MGQDPLAQDSMTNDLYNLQILNVEQPYKLESTVDTRYVHIRRNCLTHTSHNTRKVSSMKVQIVGHRVLI